MARLFGQNLIQEINSKWQNLNRNKNKVNHDRENIQEGEHSNKLDIKEKNNIVETISVIHPQAQVGRVQKHRTQVGIALLSHIFFLSQVKIRSIPPRNYSSKKYLVKLLPNYWITH